MTQWYYVKGRERIGPVEEDEVVALINSTELNEESFVWKKGFSDWQKLSSVDELSGHLIKEDLDEATREISIPIEAISPIEEAMPEKIEKAEFDWSLISREDRRFHIKVGPDRGLSTETEYGPYSLEQLVSAFKDNRINHKTYIFTEGLDNWMYLADIPVYESIFSTLPPDIPDDERRQSIRRPFVARLLFHDGEHVFEGICRDISVGGLQVLVAGAPCKVGEVIKLNVHPDNSSYNFTAHGKIVRHLDGDQGFSMRFDSLTDEARKTILNYINVN